MEQDQLKAATQLIARRVEDNGEAVESIKAVQKSRDSILVTLTLEGYDGERFAVVTRAQLDDA